MFDVGPEDGPVKRPGLFAVKPELPFPFRGLRFFEHM